MSDIRDVLGKAIGDEPPLGIDRDEVFRAGRQRVRRRRALAAGGVVAAVMVAAVGAATLTNFVEVPPEPLPPAAGDSQHAPPGPDLPLQPTSESVKPPAHTPKLTSERAGQLTQRLYESGIVSTDAVTSWPGGTGQPEFRIEGDEYLFEADFTGAKGEGVVQVSVGYAAPGSKASCDNIDVRFSQCEVVSVSGTNVAEATWKSEEGEKRNLAVAILRDGTKVAAMSSNFARRYQEADKRPSGEPPVLALDRLSKLITTAGFSA